MTFPLISRQALFGSTRSFLFKRRGAASRLSLSVSMENSSSESLCIVWYRFRTGETAIPVCQICILSEMSQELFVLFVTELNFLYVSKVNSVKIKAGY